MAPSNESVYLPSLATCLEGSPKLLSWKYVATGLDSGASDSIDPVTARHIEDPVAVQALTDCFNPPKPSAQSKAELETLTSAINVTPTPTGRYDIKELKEDTMWLSEAAQIREVQAIRLAILEWQSRAGQKAILNAEESELKDFESTKNRRQRLLEVYFTEQRWLFRCVEIIIARGIFGAARQQRVAVISKSIDAAAKSLSIAWDLRSEKDRQNGKTWLTAITDYLQLQAEAIQSGSDLLTRENMQDYANEFLHALSTETAIAQVVHGLEIILLIQWSSTNPPSPKLVLDWFSWMDSNTFLMAWISLIPAPFINYRVIAVEMLVLCSLAFLDFETSVAILSNLASTSATNEGQDATVYLQSASCIGELNKIFGNHIEAGIEIAAPVGIAWYSLLGSIHGEANRSIENRETRQAQRVIDHYGANQQSDGESIDGSIGRRRTSPSRRSSFGSDTSGQATLFEDILEVTRSHPLSDDSIKHFGHRAALELSGHSVLESVARTALSRLDDDTTPELATCIREIVLQFVKASIDVGNLDYSKTTLNIFFTVLAGRDGHWNFRAYDNKPPYPFQMVYQPLGDDILLRSIMASARGRFPLEGVPFIELCRTLLPFQDSNSKNSDLILDVLSNLRTYTSLVLEQLVPYDLVGEGDNLQLHLLESMNALSMTFPGLFYDVTRLPDESFEPLVLAAGTTGQALRDEKPIISMWNHDYSALRFCGLTLQLHFQLRTGLRQGNLDMDFPVLFALNTEIVALLSTWIMKITIDGERIEAADKAQALLANVSDDLDRNQDVVALILDLLEGELYTSRPDTSVVDFVFRCVQFITALGKVIPSRVWSFLSRSGFLGLNGQENRLTAIVAAAEMGSGTYDILLSSIQLLDILIDDSIQGNNSPKSSSKALKRFRGTVENSNTKVQDSTKHKILRQFTRIIVDVLETSDNWTFRNPDHELSLRLGIYRILHKIIAYTFNYDDESKSEQKLSANLESAAKYLVDNFLSDSVSDTLLQPLFDELVQVAIVPTTSLPSRASVLQQSAAISSINLITQFIRLNRFLQNTPSQFTRKVHEVVPILVNLFVSHPSFRLSVVRCLEATLHDRSASSSSIPIFATLSEPSAKAFLQCLSTLGLPTEDCTLSAATWTLFSAAVMSNQQWFAVYLLLGKTPKESLKQTTEVSSTSILRLALNRIAKLEDVDPLEACKLLEFVARSANLWPSVIEELKSETQCRKACTKFLSELQARMKDKEVDAKTPMTFEMAAYIVDILALLVHQSNQQNDTSTPKHLIGSIRYLVAHGVSSPPYNASLHHGLQRNFEDLFPGSNLQHFKRTSFSQPVLGNNFYYDKHLADTIFGHTNAWTGKAGRGFNHEFTRANINLSLVEAQVNLFHSWKSLAIELAEGLANDSSYQITMASIIKNCLEANQDSSMPEAIFKKLSTSRADLAFTLLQRLLQVAPSSEGARSILLLAWGSVQMHVSELGLSLIGEDSDYVRTLLRILYLSLCAHELLVSDSRSGEDKFTGIGLEVLQIVVAQGFRSLVAQLHDNANQVQPDDFALINAILRAALKLPGITNHSERLLSHFADERTIQHAGTLISWSDQLAINGDPIYGELSMTFLLELSSVQALAEAIVVDGTFAQISFTTLFSYFRRDGGCGPFDQPSRLYNIWSRGYLPLTLNIIGAIGAPVAVEVATTFAQFTPQLKRASLQFDPKSSSTNDRITLSMVNEAHSLALLNLVLNKFREAGSSVGIIPSELTLLEWDASSVKEDLESLLGRRYALRDSLLPANQREDTWTQHKPFSVKSGAQNKLEEKVLEEINAALALLGNIEQ